MPLVPRHLCCLIILLSLCGMSARAEDATQGTSTVSTEIPRRVGFQFTAEFGSSLHHTDDPDYTASTDFYLIPSYLLSPALRAKAIFVVTQLHTGDRNTRLTRSELNFANPGMQLSRVFSFAPAGSVFLPLSHGARADASLYVGLKVAPRLRYDLAAADIAPISGFYEMSVTRNVHEYDTTASGASNTQLSYTNLFEISYAFSERFRITSDSQYSMLWTYQGYASSKFKFDEEMSFDLSPAWTLAGGLSNSGSALKANGHDSNVALFDASTATIYGSISYAY
jgi:hypothetical protein